jgi:hypothetical protein
METEGSLLCSQEPSTGPHPEPDQSNPHHPISIRLFLILSTHLRLGVPSGLFPSGFPYMHSPFPIRATCPGHLILLDLVILILLGEDSEKKTNKVFLHQHKYLGEMSHCSANLDL